MATLDYRTTCELNRPVTIKHLDGMFFSQDVQANRIVVSVVRGGVNENLSGTVSANIIRADGATVAQTGEISGNVASVTMPAAAYAVPGAIAVFVKHTQSGVTSTIAAVTGYVYKSTTDTIVDPGTIIPSIQDLLESIDDAIEDLEEAIAAIPQDYQDLEDDVSDLKSAIDAKVTEPSSDGSGGQVLATDGDGGRYWKTVSGGGGGGGTSDYDDLENKPQIAGVTLIGNKSLSDLGIASESDIPDISDIIAIQDTQPAETGNEIWIMETPPSGVQVPTYTEFTTAIDGCIGKPSSPTTGQFLKWNGTAWAASDLPLYNGGVI